MSAETLEFKTELRQMMDIIIHSLYSHKEIFLRELISNAADAIGKLRFDSLTDTSLLEGDEDWRIRIIPDETTRTLTITDNGCGMDRARMIQDLGTIARSGTKEFLARLQEAKDRPELIGQFGVGFYSSFMVAEKVEVVSRAPKSDHAVRWTSDGQGTFTIEDAEKDGRGTDIILHLREEAKEFLDAWRLRSLVKKFSDFVEYPVLLVTPAKPDKEEKDKAGDDAGNKDAAPTEEVVNARQAIWLRNKSEVTSEEYAEFFRHIAHTDGEPLSTIHYAAEGTMEFKALLFIPPRKPFDLFFRDRSRHLHLYVNRVFIMDDCEKLLPAYLDFVCGVVDSSDLPLNVSREMLQEDRQLLKIRKVLLGKILSTLKEMQEKDLETYTRFWKEFGVILKSGISQDFEHREALADLCLFESTRSDATDHVTLAQYVEGMQKDQDTIYYMIAETREMVEQSPYMEMFREKSWEVLVMTDPVDELLVQSLPEYKGKKLKAIDRGDLDNETLKTEKEQQEKENADLLAFFKETLGDAVRDVTVSVRLKDSPACLVGEAGSIGAQMEKMLREMGADAPEQKKSLEINPDHAVIQGMRGMLAADKGDPRLVSHAWLVHDAAVVAGGGKVRDPGAFTKRLAEVLLRDTPEDASA